MAITERLGSEPVDDPSGQPEAGSIYNAVGLEPHELHELEQSTAQAREELYADLASDPLVVDALKLYLSQRAKSEEVAGNDHYYKLTESGKRIATASRIMGPRYETQLRLWEQRQAEREQLVARPTFSRKNDVLPLAYRLGQALDNYGFVERILEQEEEKAA